jgi:prepilin-type N-terminal cleavage/methylation domain-containing protein
MQSSVRGRQVGQERGFTLIELLIVVAIIAILAAIAIPNFLEAQTRAKISRSKADVRSLATAIESYAVDNNRPPLDGSDWKHLHGGTQASSMALGIGWFSLMTTPISYINGYLYDPFSDPTAMPYDKVYWYENYHYLLPPDPLTGLPTQADLTVNNFDSYREGPKAKGYVWGLQASGPKLTTNNLSPFLENIVGGNLGSGESSQSTLSGVVNLNDPGYSPTGTGPNDNYWGCLSQLYDPTNGTISRGRIYDTSKGFLDAGLVMGGF